MRPRSSETAHNLKSNTGDSCLFQNGRRALGQATHLAATQRPWAPFSHDQSTKTFTSDPDNQQLRKTWIDKGTKTRQYGGRIDRRALLTNRPRTPHSDSKSRTFRCKMRSPFAPVRTRDWRRRRLRIDPPAPCTHNVPAPARKTGGGENAAHWNIF